MRRLRKLILVAGLVALAVYLLLPRLEVSIEPGSILVLDLSGEYVEAAEPPLFSRLLAAPRRPFVSLLSELAKAERDERLAAVVLRLRGLQVGWGKAQELRAAIEDLANSGRRVVAYLELETFGSNLDYFVASAAQEVYASPALRAPVVGLAAEYLFLGGLWELFGVELEVERVGRYKTAADTLAARSMSEANREMAGALLDSLDAQFVEGIAKSRDLERDAVRAAIDAAAIDPKEMLSHGLIDEAIFFDELVEELGGGALVRGEQYAAVTPESVGFEPVARFALVYGSGGVVLGDGSISPMGSLVMASDTVAEALDSAARDPEVDAIIFRIDSPGGSALASDVVWRAVEKAKQQDKPVIASFSDVAASGGYYAAAGADAIVASPGSITGSIGVFALRPVLGGLYEKLGIGFESLVRGAHADLQLSSKPLSEASRERMRAEVVSIYDLFVKRVADGRALERERVDELGRGRVWTGAQAAERNLVDELGGLRAATQLAKRELALDPEADVALMVYPPPRPLAAQIGEFLRGAQLRLAPPTPQWELLRRLEPWLRAAADGAPAALLPFAIDAR
ncbi:MAG TPA: signal peptide peptidase SppA [Myxococcota bacterium]